MDLLTVVGNQLDVPCGLKDVFWGECLVHLLVCPKWECVSRSSSIDLEFDLAHAPSSEV